MPFKSKAQRGYLYANEPAVAAKFQKATKKAGILERNLPAHVKPAKKK